MRSTCSFVLVMILFLFFGISQSRGQGCSPGGCRCSPAIGIHEMRSLEIWGSNPELDPGFEALPYSSGPVCFTVRTYWIGSTPEFPQGRIHRILVPMVNPSAATIPRPVAPALRPRYSPWISTTSGAVPVSLVPR